MKSDGSVYPLTKRETQILTRLADYGESNKQIAEVFNVSTRTIEQHFRNMMNKTGVRVRGALISWLIEQS